MLVRHGLDEFVRATHLYRPLRFVFLLSPWTWAVRRRDEPRAVLILDVWNPALSVAEREMVRTAVAGVNDFYGFSTMQQVV